MATKSSSSKSELPDSVWAAEAGDPGEAHPALAGEVVADVVIIGAGFTGLSTAHHLIEAQPELRVVILEAKRVGFGASGRNGGLALNGIAGVMPEAEVAALHHRATRETLDSMGELIARYEIATELKRGPYLHVYCGRAEAEDGEARGEALARAGVPAEYLDGAEVERRLGISGLAGALSDSQAGRLNGLAYTRGLARGLARRGVTVCEHSRVVRIAEGEEHQVHTEGGVVRAPALVLATNGYTPGLGYFRGGVVPLHSLVVGTGALAGDGAVDWREVVGFSDDRARLSYGALSEGGRLVFGGGSNSSYRYRFGGKPERDVPRDDSGYRAIEEQLVSYLPQLSGDRPRHRWSGVLGLSLDRVPSIGVTGTHRNVYYGLAYSGNGVVLGNLAGRVIADIYAGDDARWREFPFYCRRFKWVPPEPFRWTGYQLFTKLTGRSPSLAED